MPKIYRLTQVFILVFIVLSCSSSKELSSENWKILFDGSTLENWDTFLGPRFKPGDNGQNVTEESFLGLNNDSANVYSIVEIDGEKVLRISGEIWGGISTKDEFENYHLQLQFKWGEKKWFPRANGKRDSGLLYHGVGQHGEADPFWLRSQEFQIQEGDCGDYWGVAGAMFDVKATLNQDSVYQYNPNGELFNFREGSEVGRNCKKYPDAENPSGEWNTVDLYCFKDTSIHMVNGVVNMVLQNSMLSINSIESALTKGKIQIQCESAEVFYKNIKISSITSLPQID